jgi:hypothetical protein
MPDYRQQANRIKDKLARARKSDLELREFGASEHGYLIGPPLTDEEVTAFEKAFEVTLPGCYRAFLTQVGNGSPVANHDLVSPEGIYPLTEAEIATYERNHGVSVGPTERAYLARVRNGIPIDNGCAPGPGCGLYPLDQASPYGDRLDIGHQADAHVSAIIVRGAQAGRVIRRDGEGVEESYLCRAPTFLDWYEGWLDEILSDAPP